MRSCCFFLQVPILMKKCLRTCYIITSALENILRRQKSSAVNGKIVKFLHHFFHKQNQIFLIRGGPRKKRLYLIFEDYEHDCLTKYTFCQVYKSTVFDYLNYHHISLKNSLFFSLLDLCGGKFCQKK